VFRFFFARQLQRDLPVCRLHTEWNRIDLVVQQQDKIALIEFKFYVHRRRHSLLDESYCYKGGPSSKNRKEFNRSIQQLNEAASKLPSSYTQFKPENLQAFLVLLYADPVDAKRTFRNAYRDITSNSLWNASIIVQDDVLSDVALLVACFS